MAPVVICTVLFLVAVAVNLATSNRTAVRTTLYTALAALFLLLLFNDYGFDVPMYRGFFDDIDPAAFWEHLTDKGYAAAMALVKGLGGGFYLFLAVINLFAIWLLTRSFERYSTLIALSWLIYFALFLVYQYGALRQGIALALTTYSLRYIIERQWAKYLLLVILATLFHHTALIFLPAYWIGRIRWSKRTFSIVIACCFPMIFLDLTGLLAKVVTLAGIDPWYVELYLESTGEYFVRQGFSLDIVVQLMFYVIVALRCDLEDRTQRILFNLWCAYLLLFFPFASAIALSSRGIDYYKIVVCLLSPIAIGNTRNFWWKTFIVCFVVAFSIHMIIKNFAAFQGYFPSALQTILDSF